MALTQEGAKDALAKIAELEVLTARLFVNNHTPDVEDLTSGEQYEEPEFSGYSPIPVELGPPTTSGAGFAYREQELSWTPSASSSEVVYGVFLRNDSTGKLHAAVRFANPIAVVSAVNIVCTLRYRVRDAAVE